MDGGTMDRITEKDIEGLAPRQREDGTLADGFLWDGEQTGFGVKATPAGKKVFIVQYRIGGRAGKTQRVTVGAYGAVTLTHARKAAKEILGKAATKIDVAREYRQLKRDKRKEKDAGTLRGAIERYVELNQKGGRYWTHKKARLLGSDMKGILDKPVRSIAHKDMLAVLDKVRARSENAARLLLVDLRPFFKWAVPRIPLDSNPMTDIEPPKPTESRERVLEDFEVRAMWQAASGMAWPFASIYRLLLLTGARREEVAGMPWGELDLYSALWQIPGARTKNGRPHRVPLMPPTVALLDPAAIAAAKTGLGYPDSQLVFSTTGKTPPSGWSKAKRALDASMKELLGTRFKEWRVHDLRRTCATGMEDLGIPTHIVETALNHVSGAKAGIVGVYQRAEHKEAVRAAFEAWAKRVIDIVGGGVPSNVIPLRKT
jgi:integrase